MNAIFKTFNSSSGDCIFFIIKDDEEQYVIMVDCGKKTDPIENFIREECHGVIDMLIVTHIDDDHIAGVNAILKEYEGLVVHKIIYNCYRRVGDDVKRTTSLPKAQRGLLESLKKDISVIADMSEHNISVHGSFCLAETILSNARLNKVWHKDVISADTPDIDLGKWGSLRLLSPVKVGIDRLNQEYLKYFYEKLFMKAEDKKFTKGESIYEYIIRYANKADIQKLPELLIGAKKITQKVLEDALSEPICTNSISPSNKASIAFVWESVNQRKRVLFLGDSDPDVVCGQLISKYKGEAFPLFFEAIKVSHHGSHYNTTPELMRQVDTNHIFFTGGEEGKRPHLSAIARIVCRPVQNEQVRMLHFNYVTEELEAFMATDGLKENLHFDCDITSNEHAFEF